MPSIKKLIPVVVLTAVLLGVSILAAGCGGGSKKEQYPSKAITMVVPYNTGGSMDNSARGIMPFLQKELGATVTVSNVPGANGIIGMNKVYDSPADGYTVLVGSNPSLMHVRLKVGETHFGGDFLKGFTPVFAWVNGDANAIAVKKDSPYKKFEDLAAKAKQGEVILGISGGIGSSDHQAAVMIEKTFGGKWKIVPFSSGGEAAAALLGGHVDAASLGIAGAADPAKFNLLVHTGPKRLATLPDVPTFVESGYKDLDIGYHVGAFVKKDTDQAVVSKLEQAFSKAANSSEFKKWAEDTKTPIGEPYDLKAWTDFLVNYDKKLADII